MKLTAPQTAEKLNISVAQLNTLVAHGKLKPINGPKEGKKRFNRFFDSVDVNKYKAENGATPKRISKRILVDNGGSIGPLGFGARLDKIESKLDRLLKMWS